MEEIVGFHDGAAEIYGRREGFKDRAPPASMAEAIAVLGEETG